MNAHNNPHRLTIEEMLVKIDSPEPTALFLFARHSTGNAGIARVEIDEPNACWVGMLFIEESWHRKGVGTLLLKHVEAYCRKTGRRFMWLTVHNDNAAALALYKKLGFEPFSAGKHENYTQYIKTVWWPKIKIKPKNLPG